jgi:ABC-type branched-subunit amino acid transport system permease subunit
VRLQAALAAAAGHQTPTGWFLALLIVLAVLYVALRTGRLGKLRTAVRDLRLRSEFRGIRIRPVALVPTVLLVIVVALLLIAH